jgi:hypothetical protein
LLQKRYIVAAKWVKPTAKEYQRTVFPSLSGSKGMAIADMSGKRIRVVNQGNEVSSIGIYT